MALDYLKYDGITLSMIILMDIVMDMDVLSGILCGCFRSVLPHIF